ncbi:MAG: hypothetical protein GF368_03810, partial [Candidatus Aenigmarchaeota archaeon]|nr:hypothetical protein [Candidatus Aenigmarchaeota archaeon]
MIILLISITRINAQSYGVQKKEYDPDIFGDYWSKKVEIYSEGDERYSYVPVLISVPEGLIEINLYKEFSDGSQQKVTNKLGYEFEMIDQDDDGLVDHISWIVPEVTRNIFLIEGKVIGEKEILEKITTAEIIPATTIIPVRTTNLPSTAVTTTTFDLTSTIVTTSSVTSTEESTSTIETDYTAETLTSMGDLEEEIIDPEELMLIQDKAEINEPVKWKKVVSVKNEQVDTKEKIMQFELPVGSENIKVKRRVKILANLEWRRNVDSEVIMDPSDGNKIKVKFSEQFRSSQEKKYTINFETPAPEKIENPPEENDDKWKKEVKVVSETSVHYKDVLSYTEIKETEREQIHLYWLIDGEKVDVVKDQRFDVKFLDTNNNGLIDRLEWIIPQLSEQIFLVEIDITVLNPYTYLRDGDSWVVAFNTTGTADLIISSPNAGWTEFPEDNPGTFDEMEFLGINCGDESLKDELKLIDFDGDIYNYNELDEGDSVDVEKLLIEDYYCEDIAYFSNYMHKAGYATIKFGFSSQNETVSDYAYDPEINYVEIIPNPAYTNDTLNCLFNITEPDSAYVNITWFVDKGSDYEVWVEDNQNEISVTSNVNTSTNSTGDIEYNNSHHDYSWICQVTAWNSTDTISQNSSALTISNYSTSMTIENDTDTVVNEQVYFYANYTSNKIGDIGGLVWNKTNPDDIISIAVFDYDGDGKRDEIVINQNSPPRIKAYFSNGTEIWSSECTGEGYEIEIFDGNNDSYDNIAALGYTGGFCILNRTGATINSSDSPPTPSSIISGDFDGDGLEDDIAIGAWNSTNNVVYMFRSNGTNWELNWTSKSFGDNAVNERIHGLDSYDIEGDGIDEIIGPSYEGGLGGCFVLHGNNGTVKWEYVGDRMLSATFVDLDHDGKRDEAVCSAADNPMQLYYFNESGDSILNGTLWEPSYETGIIDADDDGWEDDIIVGSFRSWDNTYTSYIMAFDNSSSQLWNYSDDSGSGTTNRYYSMSIGDVNDDGIKDVIGADQYQHKIHALDAHGNFLFTRTIGEGSIGTIVGTEPSSRVSDINNDGINDIITGHDDGSDGHIYITQEVSCIIHFNDSTSANMTWNVTSGLWEYNKSFASSAAYSWNVTCSKGGYDSQFQEEDIVIGSNNVPTINTVEITPNPAYTNDTLNCEFNITDPDNNDITADVTWFVDKGSGYETWTTDDENSISVTKGANTSTTSTGDVEYNNSYHDYNWICQVTSNDGTDSTSSNSSALTISNYSTSMTIENDTDTVVNDQVYFYANYTSSK